MKFGLKKLVIISDEYKSLIIILSLLWPQFVNVRYFHDLHLIICLNVGFFEANTTDIYIGRYFEFGH